MSQANTAVFRRAIEAWNRRDAQQMVDLAAPEIEYVNSPTAVEPGTRRGPDEYGAVMRAQWEVLGDARLDIESIQTAGDDVFAIIRISRSLGGGDTRLSQRIGTCATIRGGQVVRQAILPIEDYQRALREAGLDD